MGVKGLTTYLKDNSRKLSYVLERTTDDGGPHSRGIAVVVDGWSLIYWLFNNAGEPWVYGGEAAAVARHVDAAVSAWLGVGLRPTVVFDGPAPACKHATVLARLHENCVRPANLFFRTSAAARAAPRSLAEARIAPPLAYHAVLAALLARRADVAVELADGEADPHIVALAGRLGAYVLACDSDFVVLNCEGYKGYIPLDEMTWCASPDASSAPPPAAAAPDDAFQTVTHKKQKGRPKHPPAARIALARGPLPPAAPAPALQLAVYAPAALAQHLLLPPALLPLLAALAGNDYAAPELFRAGAPRVAPAAAALDVIGATVERLLRARDPAQPPAAREVAAATETVVQSTLAYALDGAAPRAAAGGGVRALYVRAYRRGAVHPKLFGAFVRGVCFPALFLEDPDRECCARSIGRPVREVIWRIFSDGGGIPERAEEGDGAGAGAGDVAVEDEDEDELVDVAEEPSDEDGSGGDDDDDDDDPLAALRGKLQRLSFSGAGAEATDLPRPEPAASPTPEAARRPSRPKVVTEYVRRGARILGEELEVAGRDEDATPVQLRPVGDRLSVFLGALGSDTHGVRALAAAGRGGGELLLVVALRWVVQTLHARAGAGDGHRRLARDKERWTRAEAQAFVASVVDAAAAAAEPPSIEDRAVQLTAQALAALEACGWLAQALLLVGVPGDDADALPVVLGQAEGMFSGRRFHAALARPRQGASERFERLWDAAAEGLDGAFRDERARGGKGRKAKRVVSHHAESVMGRSAQGTGMFGPLAGLDVP